MPKILHKFSGMFGALNPKIMKIFQVGCIFTYVLIWGSEMPKISKNYSFLFLFVYQDMQSSKSLLKDFFHSYTIISKTSNLV